MKPIAAALTLVALLLVSVGCGGSDGEDGAANPFGLEKQAVAEAPDPVAITFAPDGRVFFAEKYTGKIRVIDTGGNLLAEPFADIDVATWLDYQGTDWGLTGLALAPDFDESRHVYAFYTAIAAASDTRPTARPVLVRFTDENNVGTERTVISGEFPETRLDHQGFRTTGEIGFGPEGALYLSLGDLDWGKEGPRGTGAAQDLSFPGGKILRINPDGRAPADNPFASQAGADARVWAYGFGHGAPLVFHPDTGALYTSDANDSCEEIDIVREGGDYGWPDVGEFPFSDCTFGEQVDPVALLAGEGKLPGQFQSVIGVSGMAFVSAARYPAIGDGLLVCGAIEGMMRRITLDPASQSPAAGPVAADIVVRDCNRDVAVSPDGTIYYSNKTSVLRLLPPATPAPTLPATTGAQ
jgi:glucose/arabinose dehydrogenase